MTRIVKVCRICGRDTTKESMWHPDVGTVCMDCFVRRDRRHDLTLGDRVLVALGLTVMAFALAYMAWGCV